MAKTKLTLTIERGVVERARRYALRNDTSISALVGRFLSGLEGGTEADGEYPPIVSGLLGVAEGGGDEGEYRRHLERKYLRD